VHSRIILISSLVVGCLYADQVTLTNGDTVTGAIVKKDGDKLTIKSEFLGEVTIPWTAVKSIKSEKPLFVALANGTEIKGALTPQGEAIQIAAANPQTTPLKDVSAIRDEAEERKYERLRKPGWLELWVGYFDLGLSLTRGNARTNTLATSFSSARVTRTDKTTLYFNDISSSAKLNGIVAKTADAARGGIAYDHNLKSRMFVHLLNDYEYDQFQNLDLRFVAGGGLGFHARKTEHMLLDLSAGADYDRDKFGNHVTRSSAEVNWGDDLAYKIAGRTSFTQSFRMFNNVTRGGEYRVNFDAGSATTLRKWLSWQVTASDRLLSNPLPGRQRNDLLLTTGLRVNFAR
jgi:Protein of unknown function, DUF481